MSITWLMARRTLKRGMSGAIFLLIGLFIFEFVQPLVADSLGGSEGVAALFERLPPAFQAVMKTQPEFMALSGLAGYLSIGLTHPVFFVLTAAILTSLICRSISGEMESGSIQLALSRSVSRTAIYVSRLIAIAITSLAVIAATFGGMVAGIAVGQPQGGINYQHLIPTAIGVLVLLWAIAGVTLLLSAYSNTTSQAVGYAAGFTVISFVIDYLAGLWSVMKPFDVFSVYSYFTPVEGLVTGTLDWMNTVVLVAVGSIGAIAGYVIFVRRDLPS